MASLRAAALFTSRCAREYVVREEAIQITLQYLKTKPQQGHVSGE